MSPTLTNPGAAGGWVDHVRRWVTVIAGAGDARLAKLDELARRFVSER